MDSCRKTSGARAPSAAKRAFCGHLVRAAALTILVALSARAQAPPRDLSVRVDGEWRTAQAKRYNAQGVPYVSLSALIRDFGAALRMQNESIQIDFLGKSALAAIHSSDITASGGGFALEHPLLQFESDVLIAEADLAPFFLEAFSLTLEKRIPDEAPAPDAPLNLSTLEAMEAPESLRAPTAPRPENRASSRFHAILIDPGHGGSDSGSVGPGGYTEKELALSVAQRLRQILKKETALSIHLSRKEDITTTGPSRISTAKTLQADLVVSLHAGASYAAEAQGFEVFYPRNTNSSATEKESRRLAQSVEAALSKQIATESRGFHRVPLRLFRNLDTPGILVELGMLNHPGEESLLKTEGYQNKLAKGIAEGIAAMIQGGNSEERP